MRDWNFIGVYIFDILTFIISVIVQAGCIS
jgi:hypothetical protein